MISTKDGFFYLFVLLKTSVDMLAMILTEGRTSREYILLIGLVCHYTCGLNLSIKFGCRKHIDISKFLQPSVDFILFWYYIQNLDKSNRSMSEHHTQMVFWPITHQPGSASTFYNKSFILCSHLSYYVIANMPLVGTVFALITVSKILVIYKWLTNLYLKDNSEFSSGTWNLLYCCMERKVKVIFCHPM